MNPIVTYNFHWYPFSLIMLFMALIVPGAPVLGNGRTNGTLEKRSVINNVPLFLFHAFLKTLQLLLTHRLRNLTASRLVFVSKGTSRW